jgi:O-antigen ligase
MLALVSPLQFFFLPATLILFGWMLFRVIVKKDKPAGLVLIMAITVIVDQYMVQGIFIPGLTYGSIRYSEILILILFIQQVKQKLQKKGLSEAYIYLRKIQILFYLYLVLYFIAVLRSSDVIHYFFKDFRLTGVTPLLIFFLASSGMDNEKDYFRFGIYLLIFNMVLSVASLQMIFFDKFYIKSPAIEDKFYSVVSKHRRFGSYFGNPNHFGSHLALTIPLFTAIFFYFKKLSAKIIYLPILIILLFVFLKTYSRGAYLGLAAAMTMFMFYRIEGFGNIKKISLVFIVMISILIMTPNIYKNVFLRISSISKANDSPITFVDEEPAKKKELDRLTIWKNTMTVLKYNPFFGIGIGLSGYGKLLRKLVETSSADYDTVWSLYLLEHPHNTYLHIALFMGCIALVFFCLMIFVFYRANFLFLKYCKDRNLKLLNFGMLCGITGYLVCLIFDFQLFVKGSCLPFWTLFGLNLSILTKFCKN